MGKTSIRTLLVTAHAVRKKLTNWFSSLRGSKYPQTRIRLQQHLFNTAPFPLASMRAQCSFTMEALPIRGLFYATPRVSIMALRLLAMARNLPNLIGPSATVGELVGARRDTIASCAARVSAA